MQWCVDATFDLNAISIRAIFDLSAMARQRAIW
jgi:hypothetical protein